MRRLMCSLAVTGLAGCAIGGSQPSGALGGPQLLGAPGRINLAPQHVTPFVDVAGIESSHGHATFVTDLGTATVTVWGPGDKLEAILFDGTGAGPSGLAVDANQNLYVANQIFQNVIVYAKPYTSITRTLDDAGQTSLDVAVDKSGLVGVTNYLGANSAGSVSFFAKGSTEPCKLVRGSDWEYLFNAAFDAKGDLFVDGVSTSGASLVGEVTGGCNATSITTLSVGNAISFPGGVQVSHGRILIGDVDRQSIYAYAAPANGSLGSPLTITQLAGAQAPVAFALTKNGNRVRTADESSYTLYAALYTYPEGAYLNKIADHVMAGGVAVFPPALP